MYCQERAQNRATGSQSRRPRRKLSYPPYVYVSCSRCASCPQQRALVSVQVERDSVNSDPVLVEYDPKMEESTGLQVEDALLKPTCEGFAQLLVTNQSGYTQSAERGIILGEAFGATVVVPPEDHSTAQAYTVTVEEAQETIEQENCAWSESVPREQLR